MTHDPTRDRAGKMVTETKTQMVTELPGSQRKKEEKKDEAASGEAARIPELGLSHRNGDKGPMERYLEGKFNGVC